MSFFMDAVTSVLLALVHWYEGAGANMPVILAIRCRALGHPIIRQSVLTDRGNGVIMFTLFEKQKKHEHMRICRERALPNAEAI